MSTEESAPVVHVVAAGEIGGAERMLVDLATTTGARRHSVALFTPNDGLRSLLREAGLEIDDRGRVRENAASYLWRTLGPSDTHWLEDVLRRRGAKIVHLHTFASQVLGTRAAMRVGARVVRTEHSTRVYTDPSCWPFSSWSLHRSDALVYISEHVKSVALERAPFLAHGRATIEVVHNGVDTDRFAPMPPPVTEANGPVRFVAIGRLDPRKGWDLALEALARVPRAELDFVGDGGEAPRLRELANRLGVADRVRFSGYVEDVREAIARADVALSSAREEGLGIALLEAMAIARPVVGVPVGGIPEIIDAQSEAETGWLAEERSVAALARVMQEAVDAPEERARRGRSARARVVESFSVQAMRGGYDRVYARVAAQQSVDLP